MKARPGALEFPYEHAFASLVWERLERDVSQGPGECSRQRTWSPSVVSPHPGTTFQGDPSWFLNGVPAELIGTQPPMTRCGIPIWTPTFGLGLLLGADRKPPSPATFGLGLFLGADRKPPAPATFGLGLLFDATSQPLNMPTFGLGLFFDVRSKALATFGLGLFFDASPFTPFSADVNLEFHAEVSMSILWIGQGLDAMLSAVVITGSFTVDMRVGLFVNNHTPVFADDNTDYTECTLSGYSPADVNSLSYVVTEANPVVNAVGDDCVFTFDPYAGSPVTVYGYFLRDAGSDLILAAQLFTLPYVVPFVGSTLSFNVPFSVQGF